MSERQAKRAAIGASLVVHLAGITAMAAWSAETLVSRMHFAGRQRAIQLTATLSPSEAVPEPVEFEAAREPESVVVEPRVARIAKRRTVHTPSTDVLHAELTAMPDVERSLEPPARTDRARPEVAQVSDNPQPPRRTARRSVRLATAAAQPPSQAGTSEKTPPDFSNNAPPTYPALAIQRRWEGTVLLRLVVGADGTIRSVEVVRGSGYSLLDGQAVNAVRQWKGQPATQSGRPVETVELLPVEFRL